MPSSTYILCPGQGAQAVGMGKAFIDKSAAARALFERADAILGFSLSDVCFNGPEDRLNQTDVSQPALYVAGAASYVSAVEDGTIDPAAVTAYAGLSLGEYTALHLAGAFSFEDGLKLVAARGRAMQEAAVSVPSSMVAVMGADAAAIDALCAEVLGTEARGDDVLVPANYNAPGQIVVSGSTAACERALKAAEAKGLKAVALKVAGAFHSPIMQPGADKMKAELEAAAISVPAKPVYSNVTAQPHTDVASIKRLLVEQIVSPVKWEQTMVPLAAIADARFVELAPGRTLAGLAKRINRRLPVESLGA
ncbi:MAG: fabD [Phycisphaerales bacterium]|nr:fabD [Phycisphaerales bacterium]